MMHISMVLNVICHNVICHDLHKYRDFGVCASYVNNYSK